MRNKTWLVVLALLVMHFGRAFGNDVHSQATAVTQQAKEKLVVGTVSDDMGPVIGATVFVKGTQNGVITDMDGKFKLKLRKGDRIVVSFIGYKDKEIVYNGEPELKVSLSEDITSLQEVQVIAYGTTKKVTITGAISSVNADEILKTPAGSITNALTGKVTGLSSVQSSGQPGADDATLYVRGVGSLSEGLSSPLILVDGVERSFGQLDPNEVEDITVLKDASATAVFGVRGANGVILVTTRRGKEGKTKMSFSTSFGLQMPTRIPEFANSYEYASVYNQAQLASGIKEEDLAFGPDVLEGFKTRSNPLAYPDVDWTDLLIKKSALQTQHNFTISGGAKAVRFFASLGVFTQDGLFKTYETDYDSNYKYNRYNYRINLDIDVTKTTTMRVNLGGRLNDTRTPNYNNGSSTNLIYLFREMYEAPPFAGVGVVDGKRIKTDPTIIPSSMGSLADPLQNFYGKGYANSLGNTLNFDLVLEQKLDFLTKGLKLALKGSYNSGVTQKKTRSSANGDLYEALINESGGVDLKKTHERSALNYNVGYSKSRDWYVEAALNYKRDFGVHHVSALAMYNQSMKYYPKGNWPGIPRSYIGFVGRVTYDYHTRYMADFSVGYNGSENFAPGNRFGLFPAGSLGWIISEENFMQPLKPYLSYMKVRASLGIVGNDLTSDNSRFLYLPDVYDANGDNDGYNFGINNSQNVIIASESKKGNPDVTWETSTKQNYGLDLYFFDDRLKTTLDYFIEHRKDILTSRQVLPGYLAVTLPTANIGKVNNKGYEASVKWEDSFGDFRYNIGVNLSYAKNTIVFMDEIPQPYDYMEKTGKPVGQSFGYKSDGYFTEEEAAAYAAEKGNTMPDYGTGFVPNAGDVKYKDLNNDNVIDYRDESAIGYPVYPLLTGGVNFGFSYKGFDLSMTWSGATKTSRMLQQIYREPFGEQNNKSLLKYLVDNAWTPGKGNSAKAPRISFQNKKHNYQASDLWLRDASYLRLKNLEVGYTLPSNWVKKMNISQLRVYLSGYNLLTFDSLDVLDPEMTNTLNPSYPLIKVVNLGLKLSF
ncbi:SusC/RagA family TonB-linked outer membrane protein [Bacteroides congonensis]|uniref:SusC/RagA family TonB-linked outer membrane protein n=1 Tax=Bacteroides congonensis TaxID=1871006 RepID=UPI002FDA8642